MRHEVIGYAPASAKLAEPFHSSRSARACRELIKARARRSLFFKASFFSDPAWDILLELFAADCEGRKLSISSVGLAANIPMTTALRWIDVLERDGLVQRQNDPLDGAKFLTLSEKGFRAMRGYVEAEGKHSKISQRSRFPLDQVEHDGNGEAFRRSGPDKKRRRACNAGYGAAGLRR